MSITKLKRGETYFYVDGWTDVRGEPGVMVPTRVIEIEALSGGAKEPRVKYIGGEGRRPTRAERVVEGGGGRVCRRGSVCRIQLRNQGELGGERICVDRSSAGLFGR